MAKGSGLDCEAPMHEIDERIKRKMMAGSRAVALLASMRLSRGAEPFGTYIDEIVAEYFGGGVPYVGHCLNPEKCAGKSSCQREISCID
jgi:hypothetical protein